MPKQSSGSSRGSFNNMPSRGSLADPQTYGMLMWQSKLQEKLLQEQKEKRQREKDEAEQRRLRERRKHQEDQEENKESGNEEGKQVSRMENKESVTSPLLEIPPQMFPGPAPYTISPPTPQKPQSPNPNGQVKQDQSQFGGNVQNGSNNSAARGMFPTISNSRMMRTSISCDNFGRPQGPQSSLLGSIVSFQQMGGAGSPRRTPSGKLLTVLRGDPEIRYHQKDTRAFDQSMRYLMDRDKVQEYKRELDQQLEEQRRWRSRLGSGQIKEITRKHFLENGGDKTRDNYDSSNPHYLHPDQGRSGIELAPLIRKFNSLPKLNTLSSTDVTRPYVHSPRNEFFHPVQPNEVAEGLSTQLREKEWIQRRQQERERQATEKHFETWEGFWGRPGCGAPIPFAQKSSMGQHSVSFANLLESSPRPAQYFNQSQNGMGFNRVNLFKALHMTHQQQQPSRPK